MGDKIFIGVDPGKSGGVAAINLGSIELGPIDVLPLLLKKYTGCCLFVEHVHSFPGQGVSSSFSFGVELGKILGVASALGVPPILVSPMKWQGAILDFSEGSDTKALARAYVEKRWGLERFILPRCRTPHQGLVDAACIAAFGMMNETYSGVQKKKKRKQKQIIF